MAYLRLPVLLGLLLSSVALTAAATEVEVVLQINKAVNSRLEYRADALQEWAAPQTALQRGWGDCVEFALTKWAALQQRGVPSQKLKLGYASAPAHLVVLYFDKADPLVLDNLVEPRRLSERKDLSVVLTFDRQAIYAGNRQWPVTRYAQWARWLASNEKVPPLLKDLES